jgi:hypothetical protein
MASLRRDSLRGAAAAGERRTDRGLGDRHHTSGQRELSDVGEFGLAVDVAQNTAAGASEEPTR